MDIKYLLMNAAAVCATAAVVIRIVLLEYESVRRLRADRYREGAADRPDGAIERKFTDQDMAVKDGYGAQDSQRHREVEAGALFADIGGGQIDGETLIGIAEAGIHQGGLDALAALAHCHIGHPNRNGVARRARPVHVDFDIDQMSIDAINGGATSLEQRH